MEQRLPFPITVRPWDTLPEADTGFFCFADDYLPLHPNHAAQIGRLEREDAARLTRWAFASLGHGWLHGTEQRFGHLSTRDIQGCWGEAEARSGVRRWLFERGIPFRRTVYLIYPDNCVVQTTWRMVVRYWDAFAYSVGYAMVAVDHTLQWACCFHHEDALIFGSHSG